MIAIEDSSLVIGIGNELRGDDAVGLHVARRVAALGLPGVITRRESGEGAALIELFSSSERVYIVDAVQPGGRPGWIYRMDANQGALPGSFFSCSTHAFSVAEAVEMARALDRLPPRLVIYGVEGAQFDAGAGLSPEVESAIAEVVEMIGGELIKCRAR